MSSRAEKLQTIQRAYKKWAVTNPPFESDFFATDEAEAELIDTISELDPSLKPTEVEETKEQL